MKDFIPHIVQYQSSITQLLQKNPPSWSKAYIVIAKKLKELLIKLQLSKFQLQMDKESCKLMQALNIKV